jgi:hypothetical protein
MKPVAPYPGFRERAWNGESLRERRLRLVKSSVKAGDLCDMWRRLRYRTDRRKVMWLVQWRKRYKRSKRINHACVNSCGGHKPGSAMHDPMADRRHAAPIEQIGTSLQNLERRSLVVKIGGRPALIHHRLAAFVSYLQARSHPDRLNLASEQHPQIAGRIVDRELDT